MVSHASKSKPALEVRLRILDIKNDFAVDQVDEASDQRKDLDPTPLVGKVGLLEIMLGKDRASAVAPVATKPGRLVVLGTVADVTEPQGVIVPELVAALGAASQQIIGAQRVDGHRE